MLEPRAWDTLRTRKRITALSGRPKMSAISVNVRPRFLNSRISFGASVFFPRSLYSATFTRYCSEFIMKSFLWPTDSPSYPATPQLKRE
jgi:hypothetical protein